MAGTEGRGGRSRTKWDAKADAARNRLVEEGIARILEEAATAIATLVSPSALARRSGAVSVDTAYRLLGGPQDALLHLATRTTDPTFRSDLVGWPAFDEVSAGAVGRFADAAPEDPVAASIRALEHYIESNFRLPSYPLSRILAAVSMTASDRWEGEVGVADEHREFVRALRDVQRTGWNDVREHMRWMVEDGLAALRRRPRPGMTLDKILLLLYALADGALDRMVLYPELLTIEEVVEAVLALGIALTEEGSASDPRAPADPDAVGTFSRLIAAADATWSAGAQVDDLRGLARAAGESAEAGVLLFGTVEHLADSVIRARVIAAGLEEGASAPTVALFASTLRRLAQAADEVPLALAAAAHVDGPDSVLHELRGIARSIGEAEPDDPRPVERIAEQVVATACLGLGQWATVEVLLDVLRPPESR